MTCLKSGAVFGIMGRTRTTYESGTTVPLNRLGAIRSNTAFGLSGRREGRGGRHSCELYVVCYRGVDADRAVLSRAII